MDEPSLRSTLEDAAPAAWETLALALAALLVLLVPAADAQWLHPGFAVYDEESTLTWLQAWREGQPFAWALGQGSLHHALVALACAVAGPSLQWLRLPALLAVACEAPLLYLWVRPRLGDRAAVWAGLAQWLSTSTLLRARMAVCPALLPAIFLAHAVLLDRLRRPWQWALFGASLALWMLDYEAWALAGAVLLLAWATRRDAPGRLWMLAGLVAGAALVLKVSQANLALNLHTRQTTSGAAQGPLLATWVNLRSLLGGGYRLAFSGVPGWPIPAPWTWPLVLLGAWPALRRWPLLAVLLAAGAAPLAMAFTDNEPHRLSLALLAVSVLAGAGAAQLGAWRWGRAGLALLLLAGAATETGAFLTRDAGGMLRAYGRSEDQQAAALWLRDNAPSQGWELLDGLGPWDDGTFRFQLDERHVPRHGTVPVALIHWDYLPAVEHQPGRLLALRGGGTGLWLWFPGSPAAVTRLKAIKAALEPLRPDQRHGAPSLQVQEAVAWLRRPDHRDPWARTVAWEFWLRASLQDRRVDTAGVHKMMGEPLVSAWALELLSTEMAASSPADAARCRALGDTLDPRRKTWTAAWRSYRF